MLTIINSYDNISTVGAVSIDSYILCASGSVVEHLLAKEGVAGSIPVSRFFFINSYDNISTVGAVSIDSYILCASGSVVEHLLAKEGVAGSIPVSRFFYFIGL